MAKRLSSEARRIRGRKGMALRKRRLEAEPLCRDCIEHGRITPAVTPDHIVPLALGGDDVDSNVRCLCQPCHDKRTVEQFGFKERPTFGLDGWPIAG